MSDATKTKPELELGGTDGNAFALLGKARRAAKRAGWTDAEWQAVQEEATAGDYDHLLRTLCRHFDVT